uniref:Uncharacterized protein n=1 Tax=Anguilla anguilla TaxID=7936 RepID=A0A0E9RKJ4_ANGAN
MNTCIHIYVYILVTSLLSYSMTWCILQCLNIFCKNRFNHGSPTCRRGLLRANSCEVAFQVHYCVF